MITFIQENKLEEKQPTFGQVEVDHFFINNKGCLSQKVSTASYNIIANEEGKPYANCYETGINHSLRIMKILPKITKIEF